MITERALKRFKWMCLAVTVLFGITYVGESVNMF